MSTKRPSNQAWRRPLREALDWLRDAAAQHYEALALRLLHDPWAARDEYIDVVLDRSTGSRTAFLERRAPVFHGQQEGKSHG